MPNSQQIRNADNVQILSADFFHKLEPGISWAHFGSLLANIPGCRGIWSGALLGSDGNLYDSSFQGRTLIGTGTPSQGLSSLQPVILLGGTDYFSRPEEPGLSLSSTDLVVGIWVNYSALGSKEAGISIWEDTTNRGFWLGKEADDTFRFKVSNDGSTIHQTTSTISPSANTWYFLSGRFIRNDQIYIQVNDTQDIQATALAGLYGSSADLVLGGDHGGGNLMNGKVSGAFLSVYGVGQSHLQIIYDFTKPLFL